jgi:hypothetical protein
MKPTPQGRVILTRKKVGDFHPQNDSVSMAGCEPHRLEIGSGIGRRRRNA